jgi:putative flippase GtrA
MSVLARRHGSGAVRRQPAGVAVPRPVRFVSVGMMGFLVQTLTLHGLTAWAGVPYIAATVAAVEVAILHNFLWHEGWTWQQRAGSADGRGARLLRFNGLSALVSMTGNVALTALLVEIGAFPVLLANVVAVVALSVFTYAALGRWVFLEAAVRPSTAHAGPMRVTAVGMFVGALSALAPTPAAAAGPSPDTLTAWNRYVAVAEKRIERDLQSPGRFLTIDTWPAAERRRLQEALVRGDVPIVNVANDDGEGIGIGIPDGMIHHWRGWLFIPGANVDAVMRGVTDPTGPHAPRQEDVLESRVLGRSPDGLRLFLKLQRQSLVTVSYNTEHEVRYRPHGRDRASSRSVATRIRELENAGTAGERECRPGDDRGFLWGLNSYWRYQAAPGGVLVEMESLTLSRDLPWGVGTVVRPLIDRVARESLVRTLTSMRARFAPGPQIRR